MPADSIIARLRWNNSHNGWLAVAVTVKLGPLQQE
jgi:hypothetical protein